MTTSISLPPELERFAKTCVASGRYNNVSEVVRNAVRLLQEKDQRQEKFNSMLDTVQEETKRKPVTVYVDELKGILHRPGQRAVSVEEMDAAIAQQVKEENG